MISSIDLTILIPAMLAGIIVLSTHVPLGLEVLRRGIIFIDLAIAQIAGLGIIIAYSLGLDEHGLAAQFAAISMALVGAWLLSRVEIKHARYQEAIIGSSFILAATAGILLLAHNPHGGEHLRDMLVGQILWVQWSQLLSAGLISLLVLLAWWKLGMRHGRTTFYLLFAVAITVSVQLVGVYLVFTSLIIPSLAVSLYTCRRPHRAAMLIGIAGYACGLLLSSSFDLPAGAVIVWSIAVLGLMVTILLGILEKSASE